MRNDWSFIHRRGAQIFEDNDIFRFASFNIPNLLMLEDRPPKSNTLYGFPICQHPVDNPSFDENGYGYGTENGKSCIIPNQGESDPITLETKWIVPLPCEQEDALLTIRGAGGRVARTYTLGFGPRYHVVGPNQFNEEAFVAMDHALALARKHRIRLIIPFINNHDGGDQLGLGNFGDYLSLCLFRNLKASEFYKSRILRDDLKQIITYVLNRGEPPPVDWCIEMASHIKSIAQKTLVIDGTMGGLNGTTRYAREILESPVIDIISNHYYYGTSDLVRIKADVDHIAKKFQKPFLIGEFGFALNSCKKILKLVESNKLIVGAFLWSLRYHSRDGGFYTHSESGGYYSFHAPGFDQAPGFHKDDKEMVKMVRSFGYAIQGLNPSRIPWPIPNPPQTVVTLNTDPHHIRWFGSAWAASYIILRNDQQIAQVVDNITDGLPLYCDNQASKGINYRYTIIPVSVDGVANKDARLDFDLILE